MFDRLYTPSVWSEMERLQREMNRLFNAFSPGWMRPAPCFPAVNVWANEEGQVVTAELPGVKMDDLDISVVNDTLTISGKRETAEPAGNGKYHRQERECGSFSRTISLPYPVDADKVEAVMEEGVLRITLPRAEADKPRKITVKSA
ncbi:MAG: Hsp20/alpha crystallin family protein [Anaerolineae bacterium]|nr:Hsp20/alpha crystallin family protein [Anaerolineae bacterium]